jgi:predicted amidohydrolase
MKEEDSRVRGNGMEGRRGFLKSVVLSTLAQPALAGSEPDAIAIPRRGGSVRTIPVALIQSDSIPEQVERNLHQMEGLAVRAARSGARWIMFHEGTVCDYTPRLKELAEEVPNGTATARMGKLAQRLRCFISFGLSETHQGRYYISQVFVGPNGFLYCYRKTWIWREERDKGYRNEWARYDPGTGPELFQLDGINATCFICADGEAPRCIGRAAELNPQVVFYPNNRARLPDFEVFGQRAKQIKAPMLVTNRVGQSWTEQCVGGCVVYSKSGAVLAKANREGEEEILLYPLEIDV